MYFIMEPEFEPKREEKSAFNDLRSPLDPVSRARSATVGVAASTAASPAAAHNSWNLQQQVLLHVLQVLLLQVSAV